MNKTTSATRTNADPRTDGAANRCNGTAMRKASRRITQLYDDALAGTGMRSTQFAILAEAHRLRADPPTLQELADALVMERSALGHTVRPLERDGLLLLQAGEVDKRRRHVTLTAAGAAALRAAVPLWQQAQDHFEAAYGKQQAEQLRHLLLTIAYDERLAPLGD
jgi:DNA-binding MarR family transcriptional regulator